jgi:2'-hydroxyisoflavone reductase
MKLLVLGGTQFVGRHLIEAGLAAGHEVTLVHRGKTNPTLFPGAKHIITDRRESLRKLEFNEWDVCVDANAYIPREVEMACDLLASRVERYVFISTVSVYDAAAGQDITETSSLLPPITDTEEVNAATYGGLKVACESVVQDTFGDRARIIRPGYIVGPYDPTYRFPYWLERFQSGEAVLIPAEQDVPLQIVDARDLARLMLQVVSGSSPSILNAVGAPLTFGDMATAISEIYPADICPVPVKWLKDRDVQPNRDLPLYAGDSPRSLMTVDPNLAMSHGLAHRSLSETIRDTGSWLRSDRPSLRGNPLSPARMAELITEVRS